MSSKTPKVFISYSHDSQKHKKWVLELATRLRYNGIDAILDQWDMQPGDDLPTFMEKHLAIANYIIMICTIDYVLKANKGKGGVGYEKMIITSNLLKSIDVNKIIPIIRQNNDTDLPTFLKTKYYIDLSNSSDFEINFDQLVRTIHNAPLLKKPEIGNFPEKIVESVKPTNHNKSLTNLLKVLIDDYENDENFTFYKGLHTKLGIRRIMLDFIIDQAIKEGYITLDGDGDLKITSKAKKYAINNKLI